MSPRFIIQIIGSNVTFKYYEMSWQTHIIACENQFPATK